MHLPRLFAFLGCSAIVTTSGLALAAPTEMQVSAADAGERGGAGQISEEERAYSPYTSRAYADRVFFGDMHFHTNLSFDAGLIGTTLDAHTGYRMARGKRSSRTPDCRFASFDRWTSWRSPTTPR
jgi:hypothetical protein